MVQEGDGKSDDSSRKEKRVRRISVTSLYREGTGCLVQWLDGGKYKCGVVPVQLVSEGKVNSDDLEAAIPWGEEWSEEKGVTKALEQELYKNGIWTWQDMLEKSHLARGAIQRAYVVPLIRQLLDSALARREK